MELARDAYVDGEWVASQDRFPVRDPYDDSLIAEVTDSDDALIDRAVAAAARAFTTWKKTLGPARGALLRKLADRMLADEDRLAELCTREMGKPVEESR